MAEYISKKSVLEQSFSEYTREYGVIDVVGVDAIESIPAADVALVRHGRWELKHWAEERDNRLIDNYECSVCHNWVSDATDFCPNCGAKMTIIESEE